VDLVVKKILWGKLINVGQLCVAPDYILCSKKMEAEIVRAVNFVMMDFYGRDGDLQRNPNLGRIINDRHCLRLKRLLDNTRGKIVYGGKVDLEDLWVHPTVVGEMRMIESRLMKFESFISCDSHFDVIINFSANVPMDDVLMEEEIFGPILPIVTANYLEHAIDYINSK
jgi:aldehyde dehydrogenase (NAD+)